MGRRAVARKAAVIRARMSESRCPGSHPYFRCQISSLSLSSRVWNHPNAGSNTGSYSLHQKLALLWTGSPGSQRVISERMKRVLASWLAHLSSVFLPASSKGRHRMASHSPTACIGKDRQRSDQALPLSVLSFPPRSPTPGKMDGRMKRQGFFKTKTGDGPLPADPVIPSQCCTVRMHISINQADGGFECIVPKGSII